MTNRLQHTTATDADVDATSGAGGVDDGRPHLHVDHGVGLQSAQIADCVAAAEIFGCELLHIGRMGATLQLVIDHPDGVTVDHCADVSRQVSTLLDRDDYGAKRYVLEVSSPGIERPLYAARDYRRFRGEQAKVTYRDASGQKHTIQAEILGTSSDEAATTAGTEQIRLLPEQQHEPIAIPFDAIERARLVVEL